MDLPATALLAVPLLLLLLHISLARSAFPQAHPVYICTTASSGALIYCDTATDMYKELTFNCLHACSNCEAQDCQARKPVLKAA